MEEQIKPNSDAALERREQRAKEPVQVRKKSGFRSFMDAIRPKNPDSFLNHIVYNILANAGLNAAEDILKDGIDYWLHPDDPRYRDPRTRRDDRSRRNGVSYIQYNDMYESPSNSRPYSERERYRDRSPNPRDVIYSSRDKADMVLDEMRDYIYESGFCTIGDFYEILKRVTNGDINITGTYAEEKWGWSDLRGVRPESTYDGKYVIRLPRTEHR